MRILITNHSLRDRGGSELYTQELAIGLKRRGINVQVYSPLFGEVSKIMENNDIPVYDSIESIAEKPDIIHGHHHFQTITAILKFPSTCALYVCHGVVPWQELPPRHPNIIHYYAVSELTAKHVARQLVPQEQITIIQNWVDTFKFRKKEGIRNKPKKALLVSNQAYDTSIIEQSCANEGIELSKLGHGFGKISRRLQNDFMDADLVFAIGRTAIEALAAGCGVILISKDGMAGMVDMNNVREYRQANFALAVLDKEKLNLDLIVREIDKFDPANISMVSDDIRRVHSLDKGLDRWISEYKRHVSVKYNIQPAPSDAIHYLSQLEKLIAERIPGIEIASDDSEWSLQACKNAGRFRLEIARVITQCISRYQHLARVIWRRIGSIKIKKDPNCIGRR